MMTEKKIMLPEQNKELSAKHESSSINVNLVRLRLQKQMTLVTEFQQDAARTPLLRQRVPRSLVATSASHIVVASARVLSLTL